MKGCEPFLARCVGGSGGGGETTGKELFCLTLEFCCVLLFPVPET